MRDKVIMLHMGLVQKLSKLKEEEKKRKPKVFPFPKRKVFNYVKSWKRASQMHIN